MNYNPSKKLVCLVVIFVCFFPSCSEASQPNEQNVIRALHLFIEIYPFFTDRDIEFSELILTNSVIVESSTSKVEFLIRGSDGDIDITENAVATLSYNKESKWILSNIKGTYKNRKWETELGELNWPLDKIEQIEKAAYNFQFYKAMPGLINVPDQNLSHVFLSGLVIYNGFGLFVDPYTKQICDVLAYAPDSYKIEALTESADKSTVLSARAKSFFASLSNDDTNRLKSQIENSQWSFSTSEISQSSPYNLLGLIYLEETIDSKLKNSEFFKRTRMILTENYEPLKYGTENFKKSHTVFEYIIYSFNRQFHNRQEEEQEESW